jgi:hypothetical protein
MNKVRPLHRFPLIRANSIEQALEAFSAIYSNSMSLETVDGDQAIDIIINNCPLFCVNLNYTAYSEAARLSFLPSNQVTLSIPLSGFAKVGVNGKERSLGPQSGHVNPAEVDFSVAVTRDYAHAVLRLYPDVLQKKLSALVGKEISRPLQFDPIIDYSSVDGRLLRLKVLNLIDTIDSGAAPLPPVLQAEFEQAIAVSLLHASRHQYRRLLEQEVCSNELMAVRQAEDFIAANWQNPITLEDLVEVTGVSVLSLYRSFRKYRSYSPRKFAEQCRNKARNLLQ